MEETRNSKKDKLLELLPEIYEKVNKHREVLLANLIMIGEIPAPTFEESDRVRCLQDRFLMANLHNCSTDEEENVFGILPASKKSDILKENAKNILLVAHADTLFDRDVDHTVSVQPDRIRGAGVGDNALGLAVLATLPMIIEDIGLEFESNLIFMGASRSLGRGNIEGLKFFLNNKKMPIRAGVCVEGLQLGRLAYSSTGMLRGEIRCTLPDEYDWKNRGFISAITILNDIISNMLAIPLPNKPKTSIIYGSMRGGSAFNRMALNSMLRFEVRSESMDIVHNIRDQIEDIAQEMSSITGADISVEFFAERSAGRLPFSHPLVKTSREVIKKLEIEPRVDMSISELSVFLEHNIPAVTIGITKGEKYNDSQDYLLIDPIFKGVAQLIGIILAIDNGLCDE